MRRTCRSEKNHNTLLAHMTPNKVTQRLSVPLSNNVFMLHFLDCNSLLLPMAFVHRAVRSTTDDLLCTLDISFKLNVPVLNFPVTTFLTEIKAYTKRYDRNQRGACYILTRTASTFFAVGSEKLKQNSAHNIS